MPTFQGHNRANGYHNIKQLIHRYVENKPMHELCDDLDTLQGKSIFSKLLNNDKRDGVTRHLLKNNIITNDVYAWIRSTTVHYKDKVYIFGGSIVQAITGTQELYNRDIDLLVSHKYKDRIKQHYLDDVILSRKEYGNLKVDMFTIRRSQMKDVDIIFYNESPQEVVSQSMIDCCQIYWDGVDVWGTRKARYSYISKSISFSIFGWLSSSDLKAYCQRLEKYKKQGFVVYIQANIWSTKLLQHFYDISPSLAWSTQFYTRSKSDSKRYMIQLLKAETMI